LNSISPDQTVRPLFIGGPTAIGKSAVAFQLAEPLGGEIISVDSMQVYRGLDIGTAKPSPEEQKKILHHLIDVSDLSESFDAAKFCRLAEIAVREIQSRRHIPIFCGGTGFYLKAFLHGLGDAPCADAKLRDELEKTSIADLLEELKSLDLATFERIDRQNPRRVLRAIEVIRLTGKPFSQQRANWQNTESPKIAVDCFGIVRSSADLQSRINSRVETMFKNGLVAETEALLKNGLEKNPTAMQAIGYRQVVEYLRGQRNLLETIELVKIRTRQFAKRQMTWFRRQMNLQWIQLESSDMNDAATKIMQARRNS
jgi:tRNA dimethylallyltransferase